MEEYCCEIFQGGTSPKRYIPLEKCETFQGRPSCRKVAPTVIISAAPPLKKAFLLRDELSVNLGGSAVYPPLQLGITNIANNGQAQLAVIDGDDDKANDGENQINSFRFQDDP